MFVKLAEYEKEKEVNTFINDSKEKLGWQNSKIN